MGRGPYERFRAGAFFLVARSAAWAGFSDFRIRRNHADPIVRLVMQKVELDVAAPIHRRVQRDGTTDLRQF